MQISREENLGRIVYSRAGSIIGRSSHLEVWEDGPATKDLQLKKAECCARRKVVEQRLEMGLKELMRIKDEAANRSTQLKHSCVGFIATPPENELESNQRFCTELDLVATVEAAQIHISRLLSKASELILLEQGLNEEKGAHIRALKRVACEDASRFRCSPKLNDRYVLLELLGKGGFSEVWRAYDLTEIREVAVKIHQLDPRWSEAKKENYTKHVSREYEIHRNVRHPRIVSLFDVFEIDNNSFATVLECCNGTDLDTMLKIKRRFPEPEARFIILQILTGMKYLSQPSPDGIRSGIIHYDLKPGNILFDEYGDAKITDFGLSKIIDTSDASDSMELTSQGAGTYWYLPPECFLTSDTVRISNKVDVWSIGVIFFQMLFGKRPFGDGQSQDSILSNQTVLNAREVEFPSEPKVSEDCKQFIRTCLTYDQTFRPNIAQLCENHYIIQKESDNAL
jgi:tousled-like kinase